MKKTTFNYTKLKGSTGIYKHNKTGNYLAVKKIQGKKYQQSFDSISDARNWRATFDGKVSSNTYSKLATLANVWQTMQEKHFPTLASSTIEIWRRRYELLKELEHLPMDRITPSIITSWVERKVKFFKSEEYQENSRGLAKRCNLDNELNLFITIFNWYKNSEDFEEEAQSLLNPVRTRHKKLGFIRVKPVKDKAIPLDAALKFFECLKPLYADLALLQYLTASRIGEVAGLQWSRIDFKNRRLTIMETCSWDSTNKMFVKLNPHPKNKEPRPVYMTDQIFAILKRMEALRVLDCNFVFQVDGKPLNYCTIQLNYREAQRKSGVPYSGTHILRHGMATLARKIGGGLDAVVAVTGHKDLKLADHYSKLDSEFQQEVMEKIAREVQSKFKAKSQVDNVYDLQHFKNLKKQS